MSIEALTLKTATKIILLILISIIRNIQSELISEGYLTVNPERVDVNLGERVEVNCSVHNISRPFMLRWDKYLNNSKFKVRLNIKTPHVKTYSPSDNTRLLVMNSVRVEDEGTYTCVAVHANGQALKKEIEIKIKMGEMRLPHIFCSHFKMFRCKKSVHYQIFCSYVCDGVKNCPDGSDEDYCPVDSCVNKFQCNNTLCVNRDQVCDGVNDCRDYSDEENCDHLIDGPTNIPPGVYDTSDEDQLSWLKTTVYTVIACTVGVVLFISVVVIAVFRIKMKRAAARRASRRAERRNQRGSRGNSSHGDRSLRNRGHEQEPFISAPSPTHFGNIIVNVNNGVQFVPNSEFSALIQAPPSYSEVIEETCHESPGRHSPPPAYTTIDRNPHRLSSAVETVVNERTNVANGEHRSDIQNIPESDNSPSNIQSETVVNNQSAESTVSQELDETDNVNIAESPLSDQASSSETGNASLDTAEDRHADHKSGKHACRPKQLQVRHGEIVLDGSSSGSSSPETVNRNTQTNPADYINELQSARKSGHLQVHDGQILLTNQMSGNSPSADAAVAMETEAVSTPGQLEVVDGQILFKSS